MLEVKTDQKEQLFFKILEAMTLAAVACLTISYFGGYYLIITTVGRHSRLLDKIAFGLLLCKVLLTRYHKREFVMILGLFCIAAANYRSSGNTDAIVNSLMLVSLKNVDIKKVFKVSLFSLVSIVSLMGILSVAGIAGEVSITDYFRKTAEMETRFCFGFSHPNQWAHAVFMILLLTVMSYWEHLRWPAILLLAAVNCVAYYYSGSRAGFLVGSLLAVLVLMYHYGARIMNTIVMKLLTFIGVAGAWIVPLVTMMDTRLSEFLIVTLHNVFTGRLTYARQFFKYYGVTLFGQKIDSYLTVEGFLNIVLDLGYIRFLLENGIIIFGLLFIFVCVLVVGALKKNDGKILVGVICITLYSLNESIAIARVPANIIIYFLVYYIFEENIVEILNRKQYN